MGSLKLTTASSGSVILSPANTASDVTITVPAVTGTMITTASTFAGTGPAFSAYASSSQTVTNNTFTKVTFGTEEFDTNNNFASSTFTPTIAGYYQVNFLISASGATTLTRCIGSIYKNGVSIGRDFDVTTSAGTNPINGSGARVIYMNGTTDYLEIYGLAQGTGTMTLSGPTANTSYFSASLVRSA